MKERIFKDKLDNILKVKHRRSAVILEKEEESFSESTDCVYEFGEDVYKEIYKYLKEISEESWKNIVPREADSFGRDYFEYYDRELDNNGMLRFGKGKIKIDRPMREHNKLYQFSKPKMESFLYDFENEIRKGGK